MIAPHIVQKLLVEFQAQRRLDVVELINDYVRLVEENQKLQSEAMNLRGNNQGLKNIIEDLEAKIEHGFRGEDA